jgi:hypothetical protein
MEVLKRGFWAREMERRRPELLDVMDEADMLCLSPSRVHCLLLVLGLSFMRCFVLVRGKRKIQRGLIRPPDHAILGPDFIPRRCNAETTEHSRTSSFFSQSAAQTSYISRHSHF